MCWILFWVGECCTYIDANTTDVVFGGILGNTVMFERASTGHLPECLIVRDWRDGSGINDIYDHGSFSKTIMVA